MHQSIPPSHYVYEFSYPPDMPERAGIVFYVGKGTSLSRMDAHFTEASGGCDCDKCCAIRSVWEAGCVVVRRIVFESPDERRVLQEEAVRIARHRSPSLTNVVGGCGIRKAVKEGTSLLAVVPRDPRSFEEQGETWIRTTDAFPFKGTTLIDLAREYDLTRQVRGSTTYYRTGDLPAFYAWARGIVPWMFTH